MDTLDESVQKLQAQLHELDDEIDELTKRAENGGADVRDEIDQLRAKQIEVRTRLAAAQAGAPGSI